MARNSTATRFRSAITAAAPPPSRGFVLSALPAATVGTHRIDAIGSIDDLAAVSTLVVERGETSRTCARLARCVSWQFGGTGERGVKPPVLRRRRLPS